MKSNMKRSDLKQIIKEEYQKILSELEVVPAPSRSDVSPIVLQKVSLILNFI
jgi:hypothetical protein